MDTPSVLELFLQLTFPGPPAAQYLPRDSPFLRAFRVSAMFAVCMQEAGTTSDVTQTI